MRKCIFLIGIFLLVGGFDKVKAQSSLAHSWSKALQNNQPLGGSIEGRAIKNDPAGNLYITGYFQGTADFDPGSGVVNLTSAGSNDIFIAKYDASGNYVYVKAIGGTSSEMGWSIGTDATGAVYITGFFSGTVDFDPGAGTTNLVSAGLGDLYIAKYDASGNYVYAKAMGSTGVEGGQGIVIDAGGAVYLTGFFSATVDFDPGAGTANLTSAGTEDIFIAKYDASGNYVYAKKMGSVSTDQGYSIATDVSGAVYITGIFSGTVDFDPGAGTANLTSVGGLDVLIAKYDASGNYMYAKNMGGVSTDQGYSIAADASGTVYITGYFGGTVDFDPGVGVANLTSVGGQDIFMAKYDASGNYMYAKGIGGAVGHDHGYSIAIDGAGASYITGFFTGTVDFDPGVGTVNLISVGNNDLFIAKYDASGNYVHAKGMGGTSSEQGYSLTIDGSGSVFITGYFNNTVDFDPNAGVTNLTSGTGYTNGFVAGYNATGNFVFAGAIGGYNNQTYSDQSRKIVMDGSGNTYIIGSFQGAIDFDPGPGIANLANSGLRDIFIAKYDASGNYVYAKKIGGTSDDDGYGIAVDATGAVYITGLFEGTADFDPGAATVNLTSAGGSDIFFAKYDASGNYVYARRVGSTGNFELGQGIAVDASGAVYIIGEFNGTADFDPGAGTVNLVSAGSDDVFIAKYNASGNYVYARRMGGTGEESGLDIKIDASGAVYITGYFNGTADFDPGAGTVNLVSAGSQDIFLAKYNASGNYVYAKGMGGTNSDSGYRLTIDASGVVYLSGYFLGTADLDPGAGTVNLTSAGNTDIFIGKYDVSGNYVYAKGIGGTNNELVYGIAIDGSSSIYITGNFNGTADFDPGAGTANLVSAGGQDIFIAKYDASGNYLYAKRIGGGSHEQANDLTINGSGTIYITGYLQSVVDFDPSTGTNELAAQNSADIYIAKYAECSSPSLASQTTIGSTSTINGLTFLTDGGCKLIGIIEPNGGNPVNGNVGSRVWIESSVPTYSGQPFVARHYEVTPTTNPTTATAKVTLYFTQQEFTDFNAHANSLFDLPANSSDAAGIANLRIGKYAGSSNDGTGLPGSYTGAKSVIDPADNDIIWNGTLNRWEVSFDVTGFSGFVVQTSNFTLPLTLLDFNGRLFNSSALLNWKTDNEVNTQEFIIERSLNGRNYSPVGTVSAMNTSGVHQYNFTDPNITTLGANVVYYRLQQKDIDGRVTYSRIIALSLDDKNLVIFYPNPVTDNANLAITLSRAEKVQLRVIDIAGRIVKQQQLDLQQGSSSSALDLKTLAKGMYYLELKGESLHQTIKVIKQ